MSDVILYTSAQLNSKEVLNLLKCKQNLLKFWLTYKITFALNIWTKIV